MNDEQIYAYQQALLKQALAEGIKRNEEQTKTWTDYKKRHKQVVDALEVLPLDVSVNCMVPIGKKALMKGRLTHTNEILACLGEGYFVKYSAAQATALCNRRIQCADEMLKNLEKERDLYEMRQIVSTDLGVFGDGDRNDLVEHWDDKKLEDWRIQHREKEKEYHKKLSELRQKQKTDIQTEDDLFKRLDELELEEELEDELNRLEDQYNGDIDENEEDCYESEDDSSEEKINEMLERELEKLKDIKMQRNMESLTQADITPDPALHMNSRNTSLSETVLLTEDKSVNELQESDNKTACKKDNVDFQISNKVEEFKNSEMSEKFIFENNKMQVVDNTQAENEKNIDLNARNSKKGKRVSFADSCISQNDSNESVISKSLEKATSSTAKSQVDYVESSDEDDIIRITFKHSSNNVDIPVNNTSSIETPRDIYRIFNKPKSILKKSIEKHYIQDTVSTTDYSSDEEDGIESVKPSAYKFVVKDIEEKKAPPVVIASVSEPKSYTEKPVSKFKKERAKIIT